MSLQRGRLRIADRDDPVFTFEATTGVGHDTGHLITPEEHFQVAMARQ